MPEKSITLSHQKAYESFMDLDNLRYTISKKFVDDHLLPDNFLPDNLSKLRSVTAAKERYARNQGVRKSSWLAHNEAQILSLVKGALRMADIYEPRKETKIQQLRTEISVVRRTVTIEPLDHTEKNHKKNSVEEVEIFGVTNYIRVKSATLAVKIQIVGDWNPVTGVAQLYHYEEGALAKPVTHVLKLEYLKWWHSEQGDILRPVEKK